MAMRIDRKYLYWFLPLTWMSLILYQSSRPSIASGNTLAVIGHFIEYSFLAAFIFLSLRKTTTLTDKAAIILAIALSSAFGILDELFQSTIPTRFSDINDVLTDFLSSIFGALLIYYLIKTFFTKKKGTKGFE